MLGKLKRSKYLIFIFAVISFFTSSIVFSIEEGIKFITNTNSFISNSAITIEIRDKGNKFNKILTQKDNYMLMKNSKVEFEKYGLYIKGELKSTPDLLEGRFLNESDFIDGNKRVVLGKLLKDQIVVINNVSYFLYKNDYYEVVGILGDEFRNTPYDSAFYYTLDINSNMDGDYYLDANENTRSFYNNLKDNIAGENISIEEKLLEKDKKILEIINQDFGEDILENSKVLIIILLNVVLITEFWIKKRTNEIGIRRTVGATKLKISISIILELIVTGCISFILGYILFLIISYFREGYLHFYFNTIIVVFIISIISSLIASLIPIYRINKLEISRIIK
ncbi:MAG: ABC transporter permease [Clostridium sp.]|nr:ABC transporter permease [Clostridium sp.]